MIIGAIASTAICQRMLLVQKEKKIVSDSISFANEVLTVVIIVLDKVEVKSCYPAKGAFYFWDV